MGKPLFTFGQPQVKWTEIDDSIVLPIYQNQEKNTLVFIDSEWGEPNKLEFIRDSQTYLEKFGKLIDPTKSQKGYDYLPHYLQGNLQGNIPMYVMRVGFPDTGSTIDDYKQMTKYEIENSNAEVGEFISITQKYQGLFGKDLGIKLYYNSLFKMYSIDVINLLTYVEQSENDDSEMEILESFKDYSIVDLIEKVNNKSKYVVLEYYLSTIGQQTTQVTNETPTGTINGQNQTFTTQNADIQESSVTILFDSGEILTVNSENITGTFDGQNQNFSLNNQNITENSVTLNLYDYTIVDNEDLTSLIDGTNDSFQLQNDKILEGSVSIKPTFYDEVTQETPTGDIDSLNITYTLLNTDIKRNTFSVVVDGGSQITDDGLGSLTDGGTINYQSGEFTLNSQPSTTVSQDYLHESSTPEITDTDDGDGTGTLSDGGSIDYTQGTFVLNTQPQQTSEMIVDYTTLNVTEISDDGQGNLSDGGTINYLDGSFILNAQPQQTSEIQQDYTYDDVETITDDGQGNLSDGGTITYSTGEFTLNEQPTESLIINYSYSQDIEVLLDIEHNISPKFEVYENIDIDSTITQINSIDLQDGDIVKLNSQTDASENGIYSWSESSSLLEEIENDFIYTELYDKLQNDNFIIDFSMQYKNLSDDIIPRVKQQDQFEYYDGVSDGIIKNNLDEYSFNEQSSLEIDFSEALTQLVSNYEITSPDFGKIRYIQTLGLQSHDVFNDETHEHYQEYEQFINSIHTNLIQPRRNLVLITETKDYSGEDQVTNQLQSSNDIWSDLKGSYIAMYQPWILEKRAQLDLHLPPSFDVIQKLYQHTPNLQVQGIRRGRISESSVPVHVLSDSDKDDLSQDNVNSLMYFPHYKGTYIWDEKTHYNKLSQLSRLSQRLIMIEIEERVNREMLFFVFEPLIEDTFNRIKQRQDYILQDYKSKNWIYDYQIDLDTSLELLDNHMVILKLLIKPIKNLEFIEIKQFVRSYQNQTEQF